jgi:hypothetical protein
LPSGCAPLCIEENMGTYKGKFSSDDLSGTLGDKQSWHGVGCRIRTTLAPDRPRPRRNFDAGSVTQEWDVDLPRTPGPETDPPLPPIKDRGGMGFSGTLDFGILGRLQRPPKP